MEKLFWLIVSGNETLVNKVTEEEFIRTTFREVACDANGDPKFLGNGRPAYASGARGTRLVNKGAQFAVDDVVAGKIMTFETTPYEITGDNGTNTVTKTTVVVFGDEKGIDVANASLKRNGVQIASVIVNGKPTLDIAPKLVPEGEEGG